MTYCQTGTVCRLRDLVVGKEVIPRSAQQSNANEEDVGASWNSPSHVALVSIVLKQVSQQLFMSATKYFVAALPSLPNWIIR